MKRAVLITLAVIFAAVAAIPLFAADTATVPVETTATKPGEAAEQEAGAKYTCPMHPEVTSDKPGKCPKCGMFLEQVKSPVEKTGAGKKISPADKARRHAAVKQDGTTCHKESDACCRHASVKASADQGCSMHGKDKAAPQECSKMVNEDGTPCEGPGCAGTHAEHKTKKQAASGHRGQCGH